MKIERVDKNRWLKASLFFHLNKYKISKLLLHLEVSGFRSMVIIIKIDASLNKCCILRDSWRLFARFRFE